MAVPVGSKAYAKMSRKDTKLMHKPWGKCDPNNEKSLKFFSNYSKAECMHGELVLTENVYLYKSCVKQRQI